MQARWLCGARMEATCSSRCPGPSTPGWPSYSVPSTPSCSKSVPLPSLTPPSARRWRTATQPPPVALPPARPPSAHLSWRPCRLRQRNRRRPCHRVLRQATVGLPVRPTRLPLKRRRRRRGGGHRYGTGYGVWTARSKPPCSSSPTGSRSHAQTHTRQAPGPDRGRRHSTWKLPSFGGRVTRPSRAARLGPATEPRGRMRATGLGLEAQSPLLWRGGHPATSSY